MRLRRSQAFVTFRLLLAYPEPPAIDQAGHDRGRDFLFAPSPPNLCLMSEGEKDGYR
jgi:hypothetical protein